MRPREAALPRLDRRLRLHPRKRLELIEELAADLDALEDELAARGWSRADARAVAVERLIPAPHVVSEIEADQAAYRRLTRSSGERRVRAAERVGLAAVTVMAALALVGSLARLDVLRTGGLIVWAVIVATALLATNTLRVAFRLWVRQDIRAAARRRAWRSQLGLVLTAVSLSALGATVAAYEAAGQVAIHPDWAGGLRLVRDVMTLLSLGLGATLIGLFGWLALTPSLQSYAGFERRIASVFMPTGPRLYRGSHEDHEKEIDG